jgi:hypothetical protein
MNTTHRTHRTRLIAMVALALCTTTACQTIHVTTDLGGARLTVAGEDLGVVPDEGVDVDVGVGYGDVPYTLETPDGRQLEGSIARDDVSWLAVAGAVSAGAVLVPVLATAAFFIANPTSGAAVLLKRSPYAGVAQMASPAPMTVPLVGAAIVAGALPALGLLLFQAVPAAVSLTIPQPSPRLAGADTEVQE